jgi:RimJ/RimL family protein N-acetyltransferase
MWHVWEIAEKQTRFWRGRPEEKRTRRRWEDNIKMCLQEMGFGPWNRLMWLQIRRVGGRCDCGIEPSGSIKCGKLLY